MVRFGSFLVINQWEMVTLEALVAYLAAEKKVCPFVDEPIISGFDERVVGILTESRLGAKMFDIAMGDVRDLRLTEGAFVVLCFAQ